MAQPTELPNWATLDLVDPTYNTSNKAIPSDLKQKWGQQGDANTLRQDINYLFNKIREWIEYFRDQDDVGTVYIVKAAGVIPSDIDDLLGGSWSYIDGGAEHNGGAETLAGQASQVFEKVGL